MEYFLCDSLDFIEAGKEFLLQKLKFSKRSWLVELLLLLQ